MVNGSEMRMMMVRGRGVGDVCDMAGLMMTVCGCGGDSIGMRTLSMMRCSLCGDEQRVRIKVTEMVVSCK